MINFHAQVKFENNKLTSNDSTIFAGGVIILSAIIDAYYNSKSFERCVRASYMALLEIWIWFMGAYKGIDKYYNYYYEKKWCGAASDEIIVEIKMCVFSPNNPTQIRRNNCL